MCMTAPWHTRGFRKFQFARVLWHKMSLETDKLVVLAEASSASNISVSPALTSKAGHPSRLTSTGVGSASQTYPLTIRRNSTSGSATCGIAKMSFWRST